MHSVSGPTAAFVVLLALVKARYGLEGLLVASLMAGVSLIALGVLRLGGLIRFASGDDRVHGRDRRRERGPAAG